MRILFAPSANNDILIDTSKSTMTTTTTTTTRRYPYAQRHHLNRRIRHLAPTKIQIKALLLLFLIVITIQSHHCHSFKYVSLISLLSSSSSSSCRPNNMASDTGGYRSSVPIPNRIDTALSSSLSQQQQQQQQHDDNDDNNEDDEQPNFSFPNHRPILAIITEQDACQTDENMERTFNAIRQAVSTNQVDLVSVRLSLPSAPLVAVVGNEQSKMNEDEDELLLFNQRACTLTEKLVQLSEQQQQQYYQNIEDQEKQDNNTTSNSSSSSSSSTSSTTTSPSFRVVCSSNLVSVAVRGRAHGVHVKEHHLDQIPSIIDQFDYPIIIGTSAHSIKSALESYSVDKGKTTMGAIRPHYYFVGTCYKTASHPEKTNPDQLEGPELPGRIKHALSSSSSSSSSSLLQLPRILAIGGIDETNCHEPVAFGADGVAVIRAVLQADHPANIVEQMQSNMRMTMMMNDNHKR